jgi:hypothetical protein
MSSILLNAFISIISGILIAVISGLALDRLRERSSKPKLMKKVFPISFLFITGLGFVLLNFLVNPACEIRIVEIADQSPAAAATAGAKIGYKVQVKGYVTNWNGPVYVVVKPLNDRFWYIQPPAPVEFIGSGRIDWVGKAYLGTQSAGIGDSFMVFAVATSDRYVSEQKLSAEPEGVKSNAVLLRRSY